MKCHGLGVVLALLVGMAFRPCFAQTTARAETGLKGIVTFRPAHPEPNRVDVPDIVPLANFVFTVRSQNGEVTSFTTGADGRFQVSLPPGRYTIATNERGARQCGPFLADVLADKMTAVEWLCQSRPR